MSKKIKWFALVIVLIALGAWNGACTSYNQFDVVTRTYESPTDSRALESGWATGVLVFLGHEVETATRDVVVSKWERFYLNHGKKEVTLRIVVDLKRSQIKGQCLSRVIAKGWHFRKCTNKAALNRINIAVDYVQQLMGAE